ncbi:hypothetical protein POX_f07409 [Penicillium oxalicum]|uniref:hypothetical protein n=1 Tax=Penicillium oxalicum TaxID=69781 RepID=UPI0020B81B7B|nr:hypothetical protein POX_f07409 [Penicillium oxalicum]KAI2787054.1 hypothetical protein POX_f07409 [Penicillium oxalicum]
MTREESLHRPLAATTLTHRPIIQKDSKNYMSSFSHRDQWPPFLSPEPCECISQTSDPQRSYHTQPDEQVTSNAKGTLRRQPLRKLRTLKAGRRSSRTKAVEDRLRTRYEELKGKNRQLSLEQVFCAHNLRGPVRVIG